MSSGATIVLADSDVLCSKALREWLTLLHLTSSNSLFSVRWTDDIMGDVVAHHRQAHPDWPEHQVNRLRLKLEKTLADGRITGYQVDSSLPHPASIRAHVHAAAVHGRVDMVVSTSGSEMPELDELTYEIYHPDDLLLLIDDAWPELVRDVTVEQLLYFHARSSPSSVIDLPGRLRKAGAPGFAERVRCHLQNVDPSILSNR
ncbi:PIN domain-containing protein [Paenarthrobacter ilicis]|uniref:PIN domain-containing protein n=1 Tax=Paenarthrobacter ilicis TaxID=43665 RepID=UPI0028D50D15|nr:PIN domain-containing protein [Paenarthrobacter ilicis]